LAAVAAGGVGYCGEDGEKKINENGKEFTAPGKGITVYTVISEKLEKDGESIHEKFFVIRKNGTEERQKINESVTLLVTDEKGKVSDVTLEEGATLEAEETNTVVAVKHLG
jgi:hypothetical protein